MKGSESLTHRNREVINTLIESTYVVYVYHIPTTGTSDGLRMKEYIGKTVYVGGISSFHLQIEGKYADYLIFVNSLLKS